MKIAYKVGMDVKLKNFRQSFRLTWLFTCIGILVYFLFFLLSMLTPSGSYFYFFLNSMGIFLMFTTLLMAYSGVYQITTAPDGADDLTRSAIRETLKRSPFILGLSFITVISITLIVLIEVGLSVISNIPYGGPILMALLTIPLFLVNFICLLIAVMVFAMGPPLVAEARTLRDIFIEIKISIMERWINVLLFVCISLAIFFVSVYVIHYLVKIALGITMAVQWKVDFSYPPAIRSFVMTSYFTDLVKQIVPSITVASDYNSLGSYSDFLSIAVRYIVMLSYGLLFSFLISFPLTIYLNSSSIFFGRVRLDSQDGPPRKDG